MKACIKLRDEEKPLFRVKVPLNLLGFPFQSGICASEPKQLALTLSTSFQSGPSVNLSYRPNDPSDPFTVTLKTGIGPFGSPKSGSMSMSASFNPLVPSPPKFLIHFNPRLGDFSLRKSVSSAFKSDLPDQSTFSMDPLNLVSGAMATAKTTLPIRNGSFVRCCWGIRFPNRIVGISIPTLVLNKISIEHENMSVDRVGARECLGYEMAEACLGTKRDIEALRIENDALKKSVEGLRDEFEKSNRDDVKPGKLLKGDVGVKEELKVGGKA